MPSDVGRKPTVKAARTLTIGLSAKHVAALEAYMSAAAISSLTEALRSSSLRFLGTEGLIPREEPDISDE